MLLLPLVPRLSRRMPDGFRLADLERGPYGEIVDTLRLLDGLATARAPVHPDPLATLLGEAADAIEGLLLLVGVLEEEVRIATRAALRAV